MRRFYLGFVFLLALSFWAISCGDQGTSNTANKPSNTANNTSNAAPVNTAAIETEMKKMTTDMAATLTKNDIAGMEKIYGDNYVFVGPDGTVSTRAERIEAMKTGDTKYESISYDDLSVRTNPEGTGAIVISTVTVKGKNMGKTVEGKYRVTHVWSKSKDGWKMVNGQTTPITAAAKPDEKPPSNAASTSNANAPANKST